MVLALYMSLEIFVITYSTKMYVKESALPNSVLFLFY